MTVYFQSTYTIQKCGRGRHNTTRRAVGWRPMTWSDCCGDWRLVQERGDFRLFCLLCISLCASLSGAWHDTLYLCLPVFEARFTTSYANKCSLWVEHWTKRFPFFLSSCFLLKCIVHLVAPRWCSTDTVHTAPSGSAQTNRLHTKLNMNTTFNSKTCEKCCRRRSDVSYLLYLGNYWLRQAGRFGLLCITVPSQARCIANERGTYTVIS
jgi:hypothetical protein